MRLDSLLFSASDVVSEHSVEFMLNLMIWEIVVFVTIAMILFPVLFVITLKGSRMNKSLRELAIPFTFFSASLMSVALFITFSFSSESSISSEIAPYSTIGIFEIRDIFKEEVGENIRVVHIDKENPGIALTRDHYDPETEEFSSVFIVIDDDVQEVLSYQMNVNLDGEVFLERLSISSGT